MATHYAHALDSLVEDEEQAEPLILVRADEFIGRLAEFADPVRRWIETSGFEALKHTFVRLPGGRGGLLVGLGEGLDRWSLSHLPDAVGRGVFRLEGDHEAADATTAALSWALGAYRFETFKTVRSGRVARLCWPRDADRKAVGRAMGAVALARDLINTPPNHLGPGDLAATARGLADEFGAKLRIVLGDGLIHDGFPLIHAVGKASDRPPQLIDLVWGDTSAPRVTLVGKGVCFDTGGLVLKPLNTMSMMKNDMAGAATALALGQMIMAAGLPVRLRVLIPAVENAVGGRAFRPSDVIRSRKGLMVEVADTDAEGRLILADALTEASSERPDILIDFATLTSPALGADIPSMFCNDDELASSLEASARITNDPLWRMPLWQDYLGDLEGKVGDISNVAEVYFGPSRMAAAVYAALFLERFVESGVRWIHVDAFAWNSKGRPGRPEGGEVRNLFAFFHLLSERFGF